MKYRVIFSRISLKHLKKIDKNWQQTIINAIEKDLTYDCRIGKPLHRELKGYWKLRIANYRVIYKVEQKIITIFIIDIRHRKDIYKKLKP